MIRKGYGSDAPDREGFDCSVDPRFTTSDPDTEGFDCRVALRFTYGSDSADTEDFDCRVDPRFTTSGSDTADTSDFDCRIAPRFGEATSSTEGFDCNAVSGLAVVHSGLDSPNTEGIERNDRKLLAGPQSE